VIRVVVVVLAASPPTTQKVVFGAAPHDVATALRFHHKNLPEIEI
jgi:hypothetical protein